MRWWNIFITLKNIRKTIKNFNFFGEIYRGSINSRHSLLGLLETRNCIFPLAFEAGEKSFHRNRYRDQMVDRQRPVEKTVMRILEGKKAKKWNKMCFMICADEILLFLLRAIFWVGTDEYFLYLSEEKKIYLSNEVYNHFFLFVASWSSMFSCGRYPVQDYGSNSKTTGNYKSFDFR